MATLQEIDLAVNIPANAPPHIYAAAAEKCLEWSRPDSALKVCDLGMQRHPSYAGLRLFRAEALLLQNCPGPAEEDLRAVLASEPQHPRALKLLCHTLMLQNRFRDALPMLERAEFLLMGDKDIPEWLSRAEEGARAEAEAPPEPDPTAAGLSALEMQQRMEELVGLPGVLAAAFTAGERTVHGGPEWESAGAALETMRGLEDAMAAVLEDIGFGPATDITLREDAVLLTAHYAADASVRMITDARTREGLVAWQCRKALGAGVE